MTATYPDGVDTAGRVNLQMVPLVAGIGDTPPEITVAEIEAGFAIECAIYGFSATGEQGTASDTRYCAREETETPGRNRITIDPLEYVYDPQAPDAVTGEYAHYGKLTPGSKWFAVDRRGLDHELPYEAGQFVDVYEVTMGYRNRVSVDPTAEGQKFRVSQKPFVTGPTVQDVEIVAA